MNIALMVTRADPVGGAQIHVRDLAISARAHGHAPTVITSGTGPFLDDLRAEQIPVVVLRHLAAPISPLRDLRAYHEVRKTLGDVQPDLVATHSSKAGILGRLVARQLRLPVVFTAHGWSFTPGIASLQASVYRGIERVAAPLSSKIITVSEFDRQLALKARITTEDRVITVYNGIPDVPLSRRANPAGEPVRLMMVARFEPQKDHATLLQALAGLIDRSWELDLIGEGPLRSRMEALSASLGLQSRVRFLGQRTDVDQCLAGAHVSVLATNWEGFPLTILEAMRAGLPVVASSVGGVSEAVRDQQTGFLVPRADVPVLRSAIDRLLASPRLRAEMGTHGRTVWEQNFTLEQMVERTLAIYEQVVEKSRKVGQRSPGIVAGISA
jgi:glycosyltransferase involved in cell wall biosynthesis